MKKKFIRILPLLIIFFENSFIAASEKNCLDQQDYSASYNLASDYNDFLNDVAVVDHDDFYNEKMGNASCGLQPTAYNLIVRSGTPENYHYTLLNKHGSPSVNFLSLSDQVTFWYWQHHHKLSQEGIQKLLEQQVLSWNIDPLLKSNSVPLKAEPFTTLAHASASQENNQWSRLEIAASLFFLGGIGLYGVKECCRRQNNLMNPNIMNALRTSGNAEDSLNPHIIDNYFSGPETKTPDISCSELGHQVTIPTLSKKHDELMRFLLKTKQEHQQSQVAHQNQAQQTLTSPSFHALSWLSRVSKRVPAPHDKKLSQAIEEVQEAEEAYQTALAQLGAEHSEQLDNKLIRSEATIPFFNLDRSSVEKVPAASCFIFGHALIGQLEQMQQDDIITNLRRAAEPSSSKVPPFDPFAEMKRDFNRATFSCTEGKNTKKLNRENRDRALEEFQNFVGENKDLQVAIASLMYQRGNFDLEIMGKKGGESLPRNHKDPTSLPYYTDAKNEQLWTFEASENVFRFKSEGTKQGESFYNLEKITSTSGDPVFYLTIMDIQIVTHSNFFYYCTRNVSYEFQKNHSFTTHHAISSENAPVILKCLGGKITHEFTERRSTEELADLEAKYEFAIANSELAAAQKDYTDKINHLASRAPFREGSLISDKLEAERRLKAAQQKAKVAYERLHEDDWTE